MKTNVWLTQVWLTGMHSNVVGGYPDDAMSYVPLKWIADQACATDRYLPLKLRTDVRNAWQESADANGRIYNSRCGLRAYSVRSAHCRTLCERQVVCELAAQDPRECFTASGIRH